MATIRVKSANLLRRDTAEKWQNKNPILRKGEQSLETDTGIMKIGDGTTEYNSLSDDNIYLPKSRINKSVDDVKSYANSTFANALKGTKSGTVILLDDVSPVTHEMSVKISSDTVTDLTAVKVSRYGKNLFNIEPMLSAINWRKDSSLNVTGYWNYPITGLIPNADYTLSMASNGWSGVVDNGFYVCLRNSVGVFTEAGALCHTTGRSYYCNSKVTVKSNESGMLYLSFYNPTDERLATFFEKCPDMILELGTTATEYEPYKQCAEYTPNADGVVNGVTSLYPNTTLMTDTEGAIIEAEYNRDINKAFAELQQAVLSMGGNT